MKRLVLFIGLLAFMSLCFPALSQVTLSAESEPIDKPWTKPATLSYTRNGDGSSATTADAYLKYAVKTVNQASSADAPATQDAWSVSGFLHKNNSDDGRKNDRGVAFGYSRIVITDYPGSAAPMYYSWNAKISFGKTLVVLDEDVKPKEYSDKTKDREKLFLAGFFQPVVKSGVTSDSVRRAPNVLDMYFTWEAGLYSDHSAGGTGKGIGRTSGAMAGVEWNIMPFGMVLSNNKIGDYGVVPVFTIAAQLQKDGSANGTRKKDTYKLYSATLTLEFDTIVDTASGIGRLKPSLNFSRSIGADLLGGRAYEGKTEIAFGLSF